MKVGTIPRWCCLLTLIVTVHLVCFVKSERPIVQLKDGTVRGVVVEADGGRKVNFFQGIRFGRAERFHKPTPVEPWTGIYEANHPRWICPQPYDPMSLLASEDCLYLNVWQPAVASPQPNHSNRSVMVWIHGGAFQQGSIFDRMYDARHISGLGDVVVVSLNYRLGLLGFASFGTNETSGNQGLYDQILGLKWIQENIAQFGGNPADVTIFGESAGSISVGALVLSPLTTGLFHRAIMQSGAPTLELLLNSKEHSEQKTKNYAKLMNCTESDNLAMAMKCFNNYTADEFDKIKLGDWEAFFPLFGDELLPIDPKLALQQLNRSVDLVFGSVRNEGSVFIGSLFPEIDLATITLQSTKVGIEHMLNKSRIETNGTTTILDHYTKHLTNQSSQDELRIALADVYGDYLVVCPTILFGEQVARQNNLNNHFYSFRLMAPLKYPTLPWNNWMGVIHSEDLYYLFGLPITFNGKLPDITKESVQLSRDMIGAWTQFAKTGQMALVSGVRWTEALDRQHSNNHSVSYFSLDSTNYKMVHNYWDETCDQIWRPILKDL